MNYLTAITPKADQAQADLDCISAAREAVDTAITRINQIKAQNICKDSHAALTKATYMLADAFDDATGTTIFELQDKQRECAQ